MKKTPLKAKSQLKAKTSLKSKSGLKKTTTLKAKSPLCSFSALKNSGTALKKTILNKQNKEAKDKWEEARQKVIQRDKGKCQICGKPGTQVHHIHMRSKRKDLLYNMNNLILLCDEHHFHKATEKYFEQTQLIANSKGITVEELLKQAEQKKEKEE